MRWFKQFDILILVVAIFLLLAFLIFVLPQSLVEESLVNSNLFLAATAFLVGTFAIYLYISQKNNYKQDAANIILMEIRHAESIIDQIKKSESIEASQILLPTNNWSKYNYLFIKDLDRDELDLVNNFYNQCELINKSLSQLSISSQLEQKSNAIHSALVQLAMEESKLSADDNVNRTNFNYKKERFLNIIHFDGYAFQPDLPRNKIIKTLICIDKITTSSAGNKLKRIAKLK